MLRSKTDATRALVPLVRSTSLPCPSPFTTFTPSIQHSQQPEDMPKKRSKAKKKGKCAPPPPPVDMIRMDEIESAFLKAKERGRAALVPYLPAGFPIPETTHMIMLEMQTAGAGEYLIVGESCSKNHSLTLT